MSLAFFLIVPSVMIVSVLLIHALAKRLGLRIYYTTLIAVAVVSVMVNLAAATITPAVGREYLLRLVLMILASAACLTWANRFLLKKELAEENGQSKADDQGIGISRRQIANRSVFLKWLFHSTKPSLIPDKNLLYQKNNTHAITLI